MLNSDQTRSETADGGSRVGTQEFVVRYLGWRPVGSPPLAPPAYSREIILRKIRREDVRNELSGPSADEDVPEEEDDAAPEVRTASFDPDLLPPELSGAFIRSRILARYDGVFLLDIHLDVSKLSALSVGWADEIGAGAPNVLPERLDNLAQQIGMIAKNALGHNHFFHNPNKKPHNRDMTERSSDFREVLVNSPFEIAFYIFVSYFFAHLVVSFLVHQRILSSLLAAGGTGAILFAFASLIGVYRTLFADGPDNLNPNILLATPLVRIFPDDPQMVADAALQPPPMTAASFSICKQVWALTAAQPKNSLRPRPALGQLRRTFLRIEESTSDAVHNNRRRQNERWGRAMPMAQIFQLGLVTIFIGAIISLPFGSVEILKVSIWIALIFAILCLAIFVLIILAYDLPRVRMLRSTQGFLAYANPVNAVIHRIYCNANTSSSATPVPDFSDLIETIGVKVDGESQRIQMKQFWVAVISSAIGAIATILAIMYSLPQRSGPGDAATSSAPLGAENKSGGAALPARPTEPYIGLP